jgi:catechol 2,3-dioxygenase
MDTSTTAPQTELTSRLPSDAHVGRVRLRVKDLQRSLGFYRDLLGFRVEREEGSNVALTARPTDPGLDNKTRRELLVLEEVPDLRPRPTRPVTTGLYHVAFLVPSRVDLGRALLALHHSGYPLRGMSDHAVSESLYLDDPDGNGLEIYADRPRASWPVRDGVIQMTVDPMDVAGVVAAGRESSAPWTGLAPETTVGHVHFTVSNLEKAVAFYRDVVGFDVMMRIPSLAAVSAGGYHHHINLNTWAGEGAPADSDRTAGLVGWELRVPDLQHRRALIDRLARAGALSEAPDGVAARDPDAIPIDIESVG